MNIQKQVEKLVHDRVQSILDEYDFDAEIARLTDNKALDAEINRIVKDSIIRTIEEKFMNAFRKQNRLIDAWANERLSVLLRELGLMEDTNAK